MQWRMATTPKIPGQRGMKYIPRAQLLRMLAKRHNFYRDGDPILSTGVPQMCEKTDVILPHSKAKVDVITHDAAEQLTRLLTDPRFGDEDFLHFDNNPLQPPPDNLEYLADINTGKACLK